MSKGESEIGGRVTLSVYSPMAGDAAFVCGIYDNEGKMIAVDVKEVNLQAGINEGKFSEMNAEVTGIGKYGVKVFSWNSLTGMMPMAERILRTY